jgi:hypothetical protein
MRRGQSTAEYAVVIGLVIAAVVAMQVYVKRGVQAKVKDAVDFTDSDDSITDPTLQYEPNYTHYEQMHAERDATEKTHTYDGGKVERTIIGTESSKRTGTQYIDAEEDNK